MCRPAVPVCSGLDRSCGLGLTEVSEKCLCGTSAPLHYFLMFSLFCPLFYLSVTYFRVIAASPDQIQSWISNLKCESELKACLLNEKKVTWGNFSLLSISPRLHLYLKPSLPLSFPVLNYGACDWSRISESCSQ